MTEALEQQREESEAASQLPADVAAPAPSDWLDDALKEFDDKTRQTEPAADEIIPDGNEQATSDLEQIQDLLGSDPRVAELQGQVDSFRLAEHRRAEMEAFTKYASDLQKQVAEVAPWLPEDYADMKLRALAHDETLRLAWDVRSIDPRLAAVDLAHVQHTLKQLDPNANPAEVQQLTTLARQLDAAMRSPAVLRNVRNQILSEARKMKPPIDEQATADRDAVAFAVREARSGDIPDPPVDWGRLSNAEFREKVRREMGFDPPI